MKQRRQVIEPVMILLALVAPVAIADTDPAWMDDDLEERTAQVSEGELRFLLVPPEKPVHHHENAVTIGSSSLQDGWVRLFQCHRHLDPVGRAEVVFRALRTRNLTITGRSDIRRAWVEGSTVQLEGVQPNARLCIAVESKALRAEDGGSYVLRSGPYMRRFLDGYYPMRVTMHVRYPCPTLQFAGITPSPQAGFEVAAGQCDVTFDTWFEGRLETQIRFDTG